MTIYPLLISGDAEEDIKDATAWYRSIGEGLDAEFVRALDASLWSISRNPHQFQAVYQNVRRALLRKFPYGVFYFVFEDTVVVLAFSTPSAIQRTGKIEFNPLTQPPVCHRCATSEINEPTTRARDR